MSSIFFFNYYIYYPLNHIITNSSYPLIEDIKSEYKYLVFTLTALENKFRRTLNFSKLMKFFNAK